MQFQITQSFRDICQHIISENRTQEEWSETESDDMFQEGEYVGGFDAGEGEFCFSVYRDDKEYWFQVSLAEIREIAEGRLDVVVIRSAD